MNISIRSRIGALTCALCVVCGNLATAAAKPAQAGDGWTEITIAASGPSARAGHTMTSLRGEAYLFGGIGASAPLNDLWRFDSASGSFVQVNATNPPPARRNHAAAEFGGRLFVFGGLGSGGSQFLDDLWAYDPSTNTWTELTPAGSRPDARAFHQIVSDGSRIYLGGGFGTSSNGAFVDRWAFNPATTTWTRLFPSAAKGEIDTNLIIDLCGRYGTFVLFLELCSETIGGLDCLILAALAYGGESFNGSKLQTVHNDAYRFDVNGGGFKPVAIVGDTPPGLLLGATATYRPRTDGFASKAVIVGGELGGGQRSNRSFIVEKEPVESTIRFTAGPDLPIEVSETAAAYVPNFPFTGRTPGPGVLVFGGRTGSSTVTSRAFVLPAEAAPAAADLTGEWTGAPSQKCKNNKCRISGTFVARNAGTADSAAASVSFFLSNDAVFDETDTLIRTSELPAMAAGGSTSFDLKKKQRIKLPNGVSASGKFVIAVVDAGDTVDEGSEGNNAIVAGPLP